MKIISSIFSLMVVGCASAQVGGRAPAGEQIVMSGEWCENASVQIKENSAIEVKLKSLDLEVDRNRDHRSCQIAVSLIVPEGQSLKVKNFLSGSSAKVDGSLDFWQERRELLAQDRPVLGGVLTRRLDTLKSFDYKETQLGRLDFACGQSQILKLDLSHTIVSMKNSGEVTVDSPSYRIEYEISECRKPASAAASAVSQQNSQEQTTVENKTGEEVSAPVINKIPAIPDQMF